MCKQRRAKEIGVESEMSGLAIVLIFWLKQLEEIHESFFTTSRTLCLDTTLEYAISRMVWK